MTSPLDQAWELSPSVALRPETFGAMAYHFGNRRLTFLKRTELVSVVGALADQPDARAALTYAGVPAARWPAYAEALRSLAATDMIRLRTGARTPPQALTPTGGGSAAASGALVRRFEQGLAAPICLTWELTYACNLSCVHCLSSSGRRDPRELSTEQCKAVIDELRDMQVFYVNIGGGEPTVRPDFWELLEYAVSQKVGVKFSTNGVRLTPERARFLAATDYVDVQVSLDGATAEVNDRVRGAGSYVTALRALDDLAEAGFENAKLSVVMTRENIGQLDAFKAIADARGATLRLTRLRPSGRGADVWDDLHPTAAQQRELYEWLLRAGEDVLTGDSFFHLAGYGESLPGLNLCGAGRVVCLIDPVGDVYACPFAIHDRFHAGNVLTDGGFATVWRESELFKELRSPQTGGACSGCDFYDSCRGGCMAAKFFTGLPLDGPDPECVQGHAEGALAAPGRTTPKPGQDHSHRTRPGGARPGPVPVPVTIGRRPTPAARPVPVTLGRPTPAAPPVHACAESPLAGFSDG
ncbi:mycofactocin radical SAM maturase [Nonomuraea glycinis]|uniref:Mycofactocin maturase MftC n=1 Tax=Nonomuraea glycinis TaxID=2047744 RepID=A0A918E3K6_9ACTN|nr:mycofactocin radical SAM maturase [Nonomuraea glycinis]MCA2180442.1 mycofactocin radical SAM maturase [Nonomuraea glycinis]GGP04185.1 putative coenzyme PQQ synthesis protein E PqqE [Nonomuraea glycinis]